ncbi:hypothetical protein E8E11_000749 [Didymella keratinophila]|nr:hypothetical protein E8E11_000749 [Didymella keratinophila]
MATSNDTSLTIADGDLASNLSLVDFTVIAEDIMCAYPISDIYAPTPRFLYYSLLFLTFATLRFRWLSNIFLTGAVAYAASAAIHAFIIVSSPPHMQQPGFVSLPYVPDTSNLTSSVLSLVTDMTGLYVQPDAVELDIDPITAVVVTAYLVGLPLQIWSRTMRSSVIIRYMILLWNQCMLAGTISALVAWPTTNLTAPQYRFCYAGYLDGQSQGSDGWKLQDWKGDWNSTIWNIFSNPDTVWQQLSNNCFYSCFNTSQVIRQSTSLKAVVTTPTTRFAKLHNAQHETDDEFKPLIYVAIIVFSAAQFFLYIVSVLRLGKGVMSGIITEPEFLRQFLSVDPKNKSGAIQAPVVAIYEIGCLIGAAGIITFGDKFGRRRAVVIVACIMLVGAAIQTASFRLAQLIVGCIVMGVGNGRNTSTIPVWQYEMAPPKIRGFLVLFEGVLITAGILLAYWLNFGFWFVTQWLLKHGKEEDAAVIMDFIHETGTQDPEVQEDIKEINELDAQLSGKLS